MFLERKDVIYSSMPFIKAKLVPEVSGVYFLINKGVIVYIGQSKNIRQRISSHNSSSTKNFKSYYFVYFQDEASRIKWECIYIDYFKPFLNMAIKGVKIEKTYSKLEKEMFLKNNQKYTLKNILRKTREEKRISRTKMAKDLGFSPNTLAYWEKSDNLTPYKIRILADYLDIDAKKLFPF